jgi:hypothetical protein
MRHVVIGVMFERDTAEQQRYDTCHSRASACLQESKNVEERELTGHGQSVREEVTRVSDEQDEASFDLGESSCPSIRGSSQT